MKFDMHIHTADSNDPVANVEGRKIAREYKKSGYDGIVITDHFSDEMWDWLRLDTIGFSHEQKIDRWLKGYRSAKQTGEDVGLKVFLGLELRFTGTINDYLVYGVDEYFLKHNPLLSDLSLEEFNKIKSENMLVFQAHPFRNRMTITPPDMIDGVEIFNGLTESNRNQIAKEWAGVHDLKAISGSDFHGITNIATGGVVFNHRIETYADLIAGLKANDYSLIER